jgi:hypothetical protein
MRLRWIPYASVLLAGVLAAPRAQALFTFPHRDNDGSDQIIVNATYSWGYDTNVFAQRVKKGAVSELLTVGADYTRRAGLISVEASAALNGGAFAGLPGQNYTDPSFTLGFTKGTGRTTGSLVFTAAKTNAPDPVANDRAVAWNYSAALATLYKLIGRYDFRNTATVGGTSYQNEKIFTDQDAYSDAFLLDAIYDSKLTVDTGYQITVDQTHDTLNTSQAWTFGGTGTILPNLTGNVDIGYAYDIATARHQKEEDFSSLSGDASLKWNYSRTVSFTGTASKAFGISSTDVITDTTNAGLQASGNVGKRFRTDIAVDYVGTDFLSPNGLGRRDTLIEVPVDLGTALTTHLRVNLNYTWMENYSNLSAGRFVRETLTLTLIATY